MTNELDIKSELANITAGNLLQILCNQLIVLRVVDIYFLKWLFNSRHLIDIKGYLSKLQG